MDFLQTTPGYFSEITEMLRMESPLHAENVDPCGDPGVDPGARFYLNEDQTAGFGISSTGELKYVWSTRKGQGDAIVRTAILAGATHLNCFDGYLTTLYSRHGFSVLDRMENWDPEGPDVVTMKFYGCSHCASPRGH